MDIQTSTDEGAAPHAQRTTLEEDSVPSVGVLDNEQPANTSGSSSADPSSNSSTILDNGDVEKTIQTADNGNQAATSRPDLVEFDGPNDPDNPKNWPKRKKWIVTAAGSAMVWGVTFSSSIFSVAIDPVAKEYHIGTVTSTLSVSLFLLGFVFGPLIFGPMSEAYGRKIPLFTGYAIFTIFQIPVAVAQNVETIMLGRFFGGFAASSPLATVGGLMADVWMPLERAYAICCFASGGFAGPVVGYTIPYGVQGLTYVGWPGSGWFLS